MKECPVGDPTGPVPVGNPTGPVPVGFKSAAVADQYLDV